MKKHFVWLLLLFPLLLTGCYGEEDKEKDQGDYIWDFINYNIYFSVKDAAGNNLLDPQVASNILGNEITVEYGDKSFPLENSVDTRFNMPRPLGLRKKCWVKRKSVCFLLVSFLRNINIRERPLRFIGEMERKMW